VCNAGNCAAPTKDRGATPSAGCNGVVGNSSVVDFMTQERARDR